MYNRLLKTFIAVADAESFTKASDTLYLSPTAIMKQINSLENQLDLKLIDRAPTGIHLTKAGKIIYENAKFIIDYSEKAIRSAREAEEDKSFRVGTSILNPAKPFIDLFYRISGDFSEYILNIIPFDDNHDGILKEVSQLGSKFDFLVGICDSKAWFSVASFLPLGRYKKMVSVPKGHRLSEKKRIDIKELYGETLMMVREGDSGTNDFLRNDLRRNHPEITIEDTPQFYDLSVFNRAVEKGNVLLTTECWKNVHPSLVAIEVNWDYSIPYGLLYSLNPSSSVSSFVDKVKELYSV